MQIQVFVAAVHHPIYSSKLRDTTPSLPHRLRQHIHQVHPAQQPSVLLLLASAIRRRRNESAPAAESNLSRLRPFAIPHSACLCSRGGLELMFRRPTQPIAIKVFPRTLGWTGSTSSLRDGKRHDGVAQRLTQTTMTVNRHRVWVDSCRIQTGLP
jgi:hypothetical protein